MFARTILHVDLDAFYASVEQRDDPSLRGLPVVVGWGSSRGVVCAASYEARKFGVKSAMPMGQARALCPQAEVRVPRMAHYGAISARFFELLGEFSPLVEGLSLDEAFLDVTGAERLLGTGAEIGRAIKARVRSDLELVVSVGVAPNKFVAKIASDLGKPDGLLLVPSEPTEVRRFLDPLPVTRLWGVGEVTARELSAIGLRTVGDVARSDDHLLELRLGARAAQHLKALATGEDDREVTPGRAPVSIGHEDTYERDLFDRAALSVHLLDQSDRVAARARRLGLRARVVMVKVKYADHRLVTRRVTLPEATSDHRTVADVAAGLLAGVPAIETRGVRLTGVSLTELSPAAAPEQLTLDDGARKKGAALGQVLDQIAERFGGGTVKRAVHLDARPSASPDDVRESELRDSDRERRGRNR